MASSMALEDKHYTIDSFLESVAAHPDSLFGEQDKSHRITIYLMVAGDDWRDTFSKYNLKRLGDVYRFNMTSDADTDHADYYLHELDDGLLMLITSSKRDEYVQTLKRFIRKSRGITEMWIPPYTFDDIISYIKSKYDANMYSFTARRTWSTKHPAKIRGEYNRMIHYTGDDAEYTLKEMKNNYGVLPASVSFDMIKGNIRVSNEGFFLLHPNNRETLRIVLEVIARVINEQKHLRDVSRKVKTRKVSITIGNNSLTVSRLMSGRITFSTDLDVYTIQKLITGFDGVGLGRGRNNDLPAFSFINDHLCEDPVRLSATVVDEDKGTIFGVSGSSRSMILIPKYNTTFESFLNFYKLINQTIDGDSTMGLLREGNVCA